jgi:hypothetical protein
VERSVMSNFIGLELRPKTRGTQIYPTSSGFAVSKNWQGKRIKPSARHGGKGERRLSLLIKTGKTVRELKVWKM